MQEDCGDVKGGYALSVYLIKTAKNVSSVAQIKSHTFHLAKGQY